jgi:ABC-type hemin transport system substrate-binding protein
MLPHIAPATFTHGQARGTLPFGLLEGPAPYPGFALFSPELAAQSNPGPDVVLTITPAPPPAPRLSAVLPMVPGFKTMPAVKGGRVVELDSVLFLQASGPRIADAVEALLTIMRSYE